MTSSSVSVNSVKSNVISYHQQGNGSLQDCQYIQSSVPRKVYKLTGNEKDFFQSSAFSNSSPSPSPTINRSHISNSPNPLTPTFRRSSGGDRNRGSMRKMLPALPDMDTQVCYLLYNYHLTMIVL